jgi:decaprenylphospho-beta-D-ribofuranose 2-oxidase
MDIENIIQNSLNNGLKLSIMGGGFSNNNNNQINNNNILITKNLNKIKEYNKEKGIITVECGVKLKDIIDKTIKDGWFIHSCPGWMEITIGGAIISNVHGKDCHKFGNFCNQLISIKTIDSNLNIKDFDKTDKNFFNIFSTIGSYVLILQATIKLTKIKSNIIEKRVLPASNLGDLIEIYKNNLDSDYMVSWIDCYHKKNNTNTGRGIVYLGKYINSFGKKNVSTNVSNMVFGIFPKKLFFKIGKVFFNKWTMKLFNIIFYYKNKYVNKKEIIESLTDHIFIHNKIPSFRDIYGKKGFIEIQPIFKYDKAESAILQILKKCNEYKIQSTLTALKIHKKEKNQLFNFSEDGFSIGFVFPVKEIKEFQLSKLINDINNIILKNEGIIYLAKDSVTNENYFKRFFPNHNNFLINRANYDKKGLFSSDAFERYFKSSV